MEPVEEIASADQGEKSVRHCFMWMPSRHMESMRSARKSRALTCLSVSGHKIHGPKGVGFLYIRRKGEDQPDLIYGGGQQKGMRSGTENVPGVAGLGVAAAEMYTDHEDKRGEAV